MTLKHIRSYANGVSYREAQKLAEKSGGRLATNEEIDAELQSEKYSSDDFPCWTGTGVEYNEENCTVKELGKVYKIKLPLKNGWYLKDRFGIPSGKPSDENNPDARYLWRVRRHMGLLGRNDYYCSLRRYVYAYYRASNRFGVAIVVDDER